MAISGTNAVVGARWHPSSNKGAVYFYSLVGGAWTLNTASGSNGEISDPAASVGDHFGFAVAISGTNAVVGAWGTKHTKASPTSTASSAAPGRSTLQADQAGRSPTPPRRVVTHSATRWRSRAPMQSLGPVARTVTKVPSTSTASSVAPGRSTLQAVQTARSATLPRHLRAVTTSVSRWRSRAPTRSWGLITRTMVKVPPTFTASSAAPGRSTLRAVQAARSATPPRMRVVTTSASRSRSRVPTWLWGPLVQSSYQGASYFYSLVGGAWILETASGTSGEVTNSAATYYGISIAISGTNAVVGAWGTHSDDGAAYFYSFDGGAWTLTGTFTGAPGSAENLGSSVAISGTNAVVGAQTAGSNHGAVYFYSFDSGAWTQSGHFTDPGSSTDKFGNSVAISGTNAVVGSIDASSNHGAVFFYSLVAGVWSSSGDFTDPGSSTDNFGNSVAISGTNAVVGAIGASSNHGAVYFYSLVAGVWSSSGDLPTPAAVRTTSAGQSRSRVPTQLLVHRARAVTMVLSISTASSRASGRQVATSPTPAAVRTTSATRWRSREPMQL